MVVVIDLYAILDSEMVQIASVLTQVLSMHFQRRSSDFWGEYYGAHSPDWQETLHLKENFNRIEGELIWPEFHKYPLILEVSVKSIARSREIESRVAQAMESKAVLLKRYENLEETS